MPRLRCSYRGLGHGLGLVHCLSHCHVHISTCISTPLEEEEEINTHLTVEATFLCCTYRLFIVIPAFPLDGQREREV